MDNDTDKPKFGGVVAFGLAHVVCCGGLLLVATGAMSGVGAWLLEGGLTWLLLAIVLGLAAGFLVLRRRRRRRTEPSDETRQSQARHS